MCLHSSSIGEFDSETCAYTQGCERPQLRGSIHVRETVFLRHPVVLEPPHTWLETLRNTTWTGSGVLLCSMLAHAAGSFAPQQRPSPLAITPCFLTSCDIVIHVSSS